MSARIIVSPPERILRPLLRNVSSSNSVRCFRAAVCKTLKKPLVVEDIPAKELKTGQVRVGVKYCGINYADLLLSMGLYQERPPLPAIFGSEVAGTVLEISDDVEEVSKGDHVLAVIPGGGFAEECVISAQSLWKVSKSLDLKEVAALAISYGTAWLSLTRRANVQEGDTVLITAAAGGVGMAAVDLAANVLKAKVIGAAGGEAKTKLVLEKGAAEVIDYKAENVKDKVRELTNGRGIDVVLESVGGDMMIDCIKCLAWEGRLVVIGFLSGDIPKIPANLLLVKNCSAVGIYWGAYLKNKPRVLVESLSELLTLATQRKIQPHISKVFPLEEINQAFEFIRKRKSTGKVLIAMDKTTSNI